MPSSKRTSSAPEASNDVLAKMIQAEVNEGGPPAATPCDTPAEVIASIHVAEPGRMAPSAAELMRMTKEEFTRTLARQLDRLRDEIHAAQAKVAPLQRAATGAWREALADIEAKQKLAREKLVAVSKSSGTAWEQLRDGASNAWEELERAVRKARSEF